MLRHRASRQTPCPLPTWHYPSLLLDTIISCLNGCHSFLLTGLYSNSFLLTGLSACLQESIFSVTPNSQSDFLKYLILLKEISLKSFSCSLFGIKSKVFASLAWKVLHDLLSCLTFLHSLLHSYCMLLSHEPSFTKTCQLLSCLRAFACAISCAGNILA